jgi:transposase
MGEQRVLSRDSKERAVELSLTTDRNQSEIAEELGINGNMLARWKREARQDSGGNLKLFHGKGKARDEEVAQLRKRVAELEETNESLKKAMAIVAVKTRR